MLFTYKSAGGKYLHVKYKNYIKPDLQYENDEATFHTEKLTAWKKLNHIFWFIYTFSFMFCTFQTSIQEIGNKGDKTGVSV